MPSGENQDQTRHWSSCHSYIIARRTFHPISDTAKIHAKLDEVSAELSEDMTEGGWTGKTITLKYKLDTYKGRFLLQPGSLYVRGAKVLLVFTRAKSLDKWVSTKKEDLFAVRRPVNVWFHAALLIGRMVRSERSYSSRSYL